MAVVEELELIQTHMAQKPVLRGEMGCACVAREVSVERGGMGERGCASLGGLIVIGTVMFALRLARMEERGGMGLGVNRRACVLLCSGEAVMPTTTTEQAR